MDYEALAKQFGGSTQPAPASAAPASEAKPAPVDYEALAKQFGGKTEAVAAKPASVSIKDQIIEGLKQSPVTKAGVGIYRGVRDVTDTLMNAGASAADFVAPKASGSYRADSQRAVDEGKASYTKDYGDSTIADVSRIGGNVLATLPVGPLLAGGAKAVGFAPAIVNALKTAGFTTGEAAAVGAKEVVKNLALRSTAGAVVGGASAAAVNPGDVLQGAAIGAALPPVIKAAGVVGRAVGSNLKAVGVGKNAAAEDLSRALDATTPEQRRAIIDQLRNAEVFIPGSTPTAAQALMTPQASILQRVVHDSAGSKALQNKIVQQSEARTGALEGVATTNVDGVAQAKTDLGGSIERYVRPEERRLSAQNSNAYEAIDPNAQVAIGLPLDEMAGSVQKYLGPGSFGQGGKAREALAAANQIGSIELPAMKALKASKQESLLDAVKSAGGINENTLSSKAMRGEVAGLRQAGIGRAVYKNRGLSADRMAERMHEAGFIPDEDPNTLLSMLHNDPRGTFSSHANMDSQYRALANSAEGGAMAAETVPRNVPWTELQNLRSSMGDAWADASAKGRTREAAALADMRKSLDKTISDASTGVGKAGDNMPPDVAARWIEANKSYAALQDRFHTGPQAAIFRKGGDGLAAKQSKEVTDAFWGGKASLKEDVQGFRKLIDDSPALLGQFKSMVTTEGAGTKDAAGNLTTKFSKWVEQKLPGLRESFSTDEVDMLQRIAKDIDRAAKAGKLGTSLSGTNTYQNAQNALNLGLIDSPVITKAASMVPGLRLATAPALEGARAFVRNAKAERLSGLLSDSTVAADALEKLGLADAKSPLRRLMESEKLGQLRHRMTPVEMGDRQ